MKKLKFMTLFQVSYNQTFKSIIYYYIFHSTILKFLNSKIVFNKIYFKTILKSINFP